MRRWTLFMASGRTLCTCALLSLLIPSGAAAQTIAADFDLEKWIVDDERPKVETHLGRKSLYLENGTAYLRDVAFADGTVEVDVAATTEMVFAGMVFRVESAEECELFYVRMHKSGQPDATQYTPRFHNLDGWQLYSGDGFTAAADLPATGWMHLKLVFAGTTATAYLDGGEEPILVASGLKREVKPGSVGLWGRFGAYFANFRYTPAAAEKRAATPTSPPAAGIIADWQISPAFSTEEVAADSYPEPGSISDWEKISSEPSGIVNLARFRGKKGMLSVVFARVTIHADEAQVRKLSFGYSDQVTVFLNGAPLFSADSTWRSRDPSFLGIVGLGHDALYLDLEKGDNELMLAVTELFGGWGYVAQLDAVDTLELRIP